MKKYIIKINSDSSIYINNRVEYEISDDVNSKIYYKLIDDICQQYNLPQFIREYIMNDPMFDIYDLVKYNKNVIIDENSMTLCVTL